MADIEFDIGKEFSRDPGGRFYGDGDGSGERFREQFLLPKLKKLNDKDKLKIILDNGIEGYGSSFLTEGFAGIVKYGYMDAATLLSKIIIVYKNEDFKFYRDAIEKYVKESKFASKKYNKNSDQGD